MFSDIEFEYSSFHLPSSQPINLQVLLDYSKIITTDNIVQTHLFNGRYENIYIERSQLPSIVPILDFANDCAKEILNTNRDFDIGFWFNDMPPGSTTLPHTHDDDDELLSGVYYIKVPQASGSLILSKNHNKKIIEAEEGKLVIFKPDCLHEVSENTSEEQRLSIGINFGFKEN